MPSTIRNDINPVFRRHDYPDLKIKIGMTEGESIVIQYGKDNSSQIDLIGYVMNVTAKITSITLPNAISVGEPFIHYYTLIRNPTLKKFIWKTGIGNILTSIRGSPTKYTQLNIQFVKSRLKPLT